MTQPTYSTWPEAAYALGLTKATTWPAQHAVMELFCAHAFAQGIVAGEVACSERDLAAHHLGGPGSVNAAGELLDKLVVRRVLRELEKGTGSAPSVFGVWHWSRWEVPWRIRPERAADRIAAFSVLETRAQSGISARVYIRALTKSARLFSQGVSDFARGPMDPRASDETLISKASSEARDPRANSDGRGPSHLFTIERDSVSLSEGGREQRLRTTELCTAVRRSCRVTWLSRPLVGRLAHLAAEANGRFGELVARAADPTGPRGLVDRIDWIEAALFDEAPDELSREAPKSSAQQILESSLAAMEMSGEGGSQEALEMRERLATLGP